MNLHLTPAKGFLLLLFGFLFVIHDQNIAGINLILPDFIGYYLILLGLRLLAPVHRSFEKARPLASVMVIFTIFTDSIKALSDFLFGETTTAYKLAFVLPINVADIIIELLIVWYVCKGIMQLAIARNNHSLAKGAKTSRNFYLFYYIAAWITLGVVWLMAMLWPLTWFMPFESAHTQSINRLHITAPIYTIYALRVILICLMLALLWRAYKEIGEHKTATAAGYSNRLLRDKLRKYSPYLISVVVTLVAAIAMILSTVLFFRSQTAYVAWQVNYLSTVWPFVEASNFCLYQLLLAFGCTCVLYIPLLLYCWKRKIAFLVIQSAVCGTLAGYGAMLAVFTCLFPAYHFIE